VSEAGAFYQVPTEPKKVVNPIGSGDAFTAGFASAFASGKPIQESVSEGNRCGLLNAMQLAPGTLSAKPT